MEVAYAPRRAAPTLVSALGGFLEMIRPLPALHHCELPSPPAAPYLSEPTALVDFLALARAEIVIAHLPLHAAEVDPVSAGDDTLLEDLLQNRFMQGLSVPRGK